MSTVFFRRKGQTIRHVQDHQDIPRDYWYCDGNSGNEFDVRDLPAIYIAEDRQAVAAGDRAAHRRVITRAIDGAHDFRRVHATA